MGCETIYGGRLKTAGQERPYQAVEHPAKMPTSMARDHIISWSNSGDTVFDPFTGSATTGVEALKLSRKFIGCEISQEYYDMSIRNLNNVAPLANLFTYPV